MFGADGAFGLAVVAGLVVDVAEVAAGGEGGVSCGKSMWEMGVDWDEEGRRGDA